MSYRRSRAVTGVCEAYASRFGSRGLTEAKRRFESAQALSAALEPIIDVCIRIGVTSAELESLVRVEFVRHLAQTLPGNIRTGRAASHEVIALAAGLNRMEVQKILANGASAELRMQKKAQKHSKSERVLSLWSKHHRYRSSSGVPLDLPLELQADGPSFSELVNKVLPGIQPKAVLKDLRRRGQVQLLPDEIVHFRRTAALPTELTPQAIANAAEQMRLLGQTLLQSIRDPDESTTGEFATFASSDPISVPADLVGLNQRAIQARIGSFVQGFEMEFGRTARKAKKGKAPSKTIGVSVYTWRKN